MDDPIVTVEQGQLKGRVAVDHYGGKYYSFQGIPYAKPPVGELRFKVCDVYFLKIIERKKNLSNVNLPNPVRYY